MLLQVTRFLLTWPVIGALAVVGLLPVYGPQMVYIEGSLDPVTSKITITEQTPADGGLNIRFTYEKKRFCELQGLIAKAAQFNVAISLAPVDASPASVRAPGTQTSRLWHVDAMSMDGLTIWFVHRCSPLWLTATQVFP